MPLAERRLRRMGARPSILLGTLLSGALLGALSVAGCTSERASTASSSQRDTRALIEQLLPPTVSDRNGWTADMQSAFKSLQLDATPRNVCAVIAVVQQESGFQVDPVIPHLGTLATREIDERAGAAHVPLVLVHGALDIPSSDGRTYAERILAAHTERDLSRVFDDFIGRVPLGRTLFASWNPIRTRGPMQVNVAFAQKFAAVRPYPYPIHESLEDELFTRRGSLYFGIAHLLAYSAPYPEYLYRFADYNAGQYASRNAAFQHAASIASGRSLVSDGALLPPRNAATGSTELTLFALSDRLGLTQSQIRDALAESGREEFEHTALYQRVFAVGQRKSGARLPRARVPQIALHGPKIERKLTTEWYAHRVNDRFTRCLGHAE